jgi:signal transduction histidine kinase/DNA-binding response OmpR family regulator
MKNSRGGAMSFHDSDRELPLVLVVDDDISVRLLAQASLEQAGFVVEEAESGETALSAFTRFHPDIVLLDVMMPDVDGFSVCTEMRKLPGGDLTPIVMVTGSDDLESINRSFEVGAAEFIAKPINWRTLGHHVRYVLRASRAFLELTRSERALRLSEEALSQSYFNQSVINMILRESLDDRPLEIVFQKALNMMLSVPWLTLATDASIFLVEDESEVLVKKAQSNLIEPQIKLTDRIPLGTCLCGRAAQTQKIEFSESLDECHEMYSGGMVSYGHYAVPIVFSGKTLGIIYISFKEKPVRRYNEEDFLLSLADTLAGIIVRKKAEEERVKLYNQLLHAQKMEAIGTLAGGIAHDFNNLLMGILGYTSLMLMKTDKTHPFYEKLKIIEQQVESGAELTRQLLGFARGGKYEVKPINVNELIVKALDIFGRTKKEITIRKNLQADLHTIEADRGQFEQVLFNLYVNAWQAMPLGGSLYIETKNVMLDEKQFGTYKVEPGPYVKISVVDTGIGMDAETQKRIFEPFFTTKSVGKGTGLGLASAYGIIKNHGGTINVYSEKGHGTTITVYLPASEAKADEAKPDEGDLLTGDEAILIVDDERANTESVKELLEILGYTVMVANGGKEATELYRENPGTIQLVILDMIMPEMNGRETLVKLMELDKNVRVLLSSGYSIDGEAKTILDLGCRGFIQKPFRIEELSQKIREVLDSSAS